MGTIAQLASRIKQWRTQFNLTEFVETGSGRGDSIEAALQLGFQGIHSIEIDNECFEYCKDLFADEARVQLHMGWSTDILPSIIQVLPRTSGTLFWFDAHFPGCYTTNTVNYPQTRRETPLIEEIQLFFSKPGNDRDVLIIDDLRLYEEGEYEGGDVPELREAVDKHGWTSALYSLGVTHVLHRIYLDQGYLVALPRE